MTSELQDIRVERPTSEAAVVVFTGEHDLASVDKIQDLLDSVVAQNEVVVADFSEAEFVDSSVLRTLLRAHMAAQNRGSSFRLQLGTAAVVERAFQLTGILGHLSCWESRADALYGAGLSRKVKEAAA